jgi:phospholipase/carboxylesterase
VKLVETDTAVTIEPTGKPRASVIWMHGLGADGYDFVPIVSDLDLPADAGIRFVFPHAPVRPVTLNAGMPMRAWYDIVSLDRAGKVDEKGIRESEARVRKLIADQDVESSRIVIAGFSQGGAIALHTALRHPDPLAGVLALSTYLPLADDLARAASPANRQTPILMCHGQYDAILSLEFGQTSRDRLVALGHKVEWHEYPMAHEVCAEEIERIGSWLRERLLGPDAESR